MENDRIFKKPLPWVRRGPSFDSKVWELFVANANEKYNDEIDNQVKYLNSLPEAERIDRIKKIIQIHTEYAKQYRFKNLEAWQEADEQKNLKALNQYREWLNELDYTILNVSADNDKLSVSAIAIMHVYWGKVEPEKAFTKTNINVLRQNYINPKKNEPYSGTRLVRAYETYLEEKGRLTLSDSSKKSRTAHIQRYEAFLPILKVACSGAYSAAFRDYNLLLSKYDVYNKK